MGFVASCGLRILSMYAFPRCLSGKFLSLWIRYCLRHAPAGSYVVILGRDARGQRAQNEIYRDCGPCGLNPSTYLRIFKNVGDDEKDEEIPIRTNYPKCEYVTISPHEWAAFAPNAGTLIGQVETNDGRFQGTGLRVDVQDLRDQEREGLEQQMNQALQDPLFFDQTSKYFG